MDGRHAVPPLIEEDSTGDQRGQREPPAGDTGQPVGIRRPESLRNLQLEYGAEIGRAVVNFDGPIVFCVVSRYHGGAFVVFSGTLNEYRTLDAHRASASSRRAVSVQDRSGLPGDAHYCWVCRDG
jgi:hypothetical protein